MSLQAVVDATADVVSVFKPAFVDQVLTEPPPKLPDDRCFVIYPDPGNVTLMANQGRGGSAVYQADDAIVINFHMKAANDSWMEMEPQSRAMLIATRDALLAAVKNGALGGTIMGFQSLDTMDYGLLTWWVADTTCGFSLALRIRHGVEIAT